MAKIIGTNLQFNQVQGIPRGGLRLAKALEIYCGNNGPILVVDDVLTTGQSILEIRQAIPEPSLGVVIFARGKCPEGILALFQLSEEFMTKVPFKVIE